MRPSHPAVAAACLALLSGAPAFAASPQRTPLELATAVETRAAATDFGELTAFGEAAMRRPGREGLNRLYHVAWIYLNQADFEAAQVWNDRLEQAARRQNDGRYVMIAHLNALAIRYDQGDQAAARQMQALSTSERDWFTRAHATRLYALALMDEDRIGEALDLLADAETKIPERDPYAWTARAGVWEMVGIGLMKLNDLNGAATAFGRFEIDFSDAAYPRPDFDSLYNLARLSAQVGDVRSAEQFFAAHHRLTNGRGWPASAPMTPICAPRSPTRATTRAGCWTA